MVFLYSIRRTIGYRIWIPKPPLTDVEKEKQKQETQIECPIVPVTDQTKKALIARIDRIIISKEGKFYLFMKIILINQHGLLIFKIKFKKNDTCDISVYHRNRKGPIKYLPGIFAIIKSLNFTPFDHILFISL